MTAVLRTNRLSLGYQNDILIQDLSIEIKQGTTLAVVGPNGSGKSTLVKALLGLIKPITGRVEWCMQQSRESGYLAQTSEFDRNFPIRVRDLAAMGSWRGFLWWPGLHPSLKNRVQRALDQVGIGTIADSPLHLLSGGQLQRALFARVIVQDAPIVFLDEPFNGIDQNTEAHLLTIIDHWRDEGRAVVMVVHDISSVLDHCDEALLLGAGKSSFGPVRDIITLERLVEHSYLSSSQASWFQRNPVLATDRRHV